MTAADHANTVRAGLRNIVPPSQLQAAHRALDALQAQAETNAGAQHVRETLIAEADMQRERAEAAEAERDRQVKESLRIADERDRLADVIRKTWPRKAERIIRAALADTEHTP